MVPRLGSPVDNPEDVAVEVLKTEICYPKMADLAICVAYKYGDSLGQFGYSMYLLAQPSSRC